MMTAAELCAAIREELGDDLGKTVTDPELVRFLNRGQSRLGVFKAATSTVTLNAGDTQLTLPADFHDIESLDAPVALPSYDRWGGALLFQCPLTSSCAATLRYYATWPKITGRVDSQLGDVGDDAIISFALYRFFKRLASGRADYRAFATMTGQNGVDITELDGLSERHYNDFLDAADQLQQTVPSYFYGG